MLRRAIRRVCFAVFTALSLLGPLPVLAGADQYPYTETAPTIPETVGEIRRNKAGKIVRRGQHDAAPANGRVHTFHFTHSTDFQRKADRMQQRIDAIVATEAVRKLNGHVPVDGQGLTQRERKLVQRLAKTDLSVRQHEMKHYLTGRPYTAAPKYWYVMGPDKRRYIMAGVTPFSIAADGPIQYEPLEKLEALRRAALAPWQPSTTDRKVAAYLGRLIDQRKRLETHRND